MNNQSRDVYDIVAMLFSSPYGNVWSYHKDSFFVIMLLKYGIICNMMLNTSFIILKRSELHVSGFFHRDGKLSERFERK